MDRNKGSSTVEACIVVPLFLFYMLGIVYMGMMLMADAHIHQSLAEAAIYGAGYCYAEMRLTERSGEENNTREGNTVANNFMTSNTKANSLVNMTIINGQFHKYLGDDAFVDKVVVGGVRGIIITTSTDPDNAKIFHAKASYMVRIPIPIIGSYQLARTDEIKQKGLLGYDCNEKPEDSDIYVYITPNESVYHMSRGCSHLNRKVAVRTGHGDYPPCSFCGKRGNARGEVYIAENGNVYHNDSHCLGLKRTVIRVKKNTVAQLKPCSSCGR